MSVGAIRDVDEPIWRLLGDYPWTARETLYDPRNGPCAACGDRPLPEGAACLVCSASHRRRGRVPMRGALAGGTGPRPAKSNSKVTGKS